MRFGTERLVLERPSRLNGDDSCSGLNVWLACDFPQPRFQSWGPIPWSRVLLSFDRKKIDRSTQFGAVGYIITLYSSQSYVKCWGSVQILGRFGPPSFPTPSDCSHGGEVPLRTAISVTDCVFISRNMSCTWSVLNKLTFTSCWHCALSSERSVSFVTLGQFQSCLAQDAGACI